MAQVSSGTMSPKMQKILGSVGAIGVLTLGVSTTAILIKKSKKSVHFNEVVWEQEFEKGSVPDDIDPYSTW